VAIHERILVQDNASCCPLDSLKASCMLERSAIQLRRTRLMCYMFWYLENKYQKTYFFTRAFNVLCDLPFLMFYQIHVMHLCSDCNRRTRNT